MVEALLTAALPAQQRRVVPEDDGLALLTAADLDADQLGDALHDGALQALVAARYAADAAVRGGDPVLARDAVQEALVALRQAVWLLRPRGADDLPAALAELSTRLEAPLELDVDPAAVAGLAPPARAVVYRFVQAARPRAVSLVREGGCAVLTVDADVADPTGWAARARAVGGRLDGASRLRLPLPDSDPEGDR